MINEAFKKDLSKYVKNTPINQELPAGATSRRYEPESGVKKHNERIHKESKYADDNKNLPFSFRKPPKARGSAIYVQCDSCGHILPATTVTVGVICSNCKNFSSVTEVNFDR